MSENRGGAIAHDRTAFLRACEHDVIVRKPGNVSVASPGHGMDASMFLAAARAAVAPLFAAGTRVGARIEDAVSAAFAATACNTNLGIVLLCAPLAVAREREPMATTAAALRAAVERVLARLVVSDARAAFRAIARANPGGLANAIEHDVRSIPEVDLRAAMLAAADRDSIARQYANGYADVFGIGLPHFARAGEARSERAVLACYLDYLARFPDSHIVRKHGLDVARAVCEEASQRVARHDDGVPGADEIAAWDLEYKSRGINPGTSADLTVAAAFVSGTLRRFA
jgi:triphosphoribosyl-dephospho-CoA synthase